MTSFIRRYVLKVHAALLTCTLLFVLSSGQAQTDQSGFELIFLSDDPALTAVGEKKAGNKVGLWSYFSSDSTFFQTGNYTEQGLKSGFWKVFIKGIERARIKYLNDTINGTYQLFHPNRFAAVNANFKKGKLDGEWVSYTDRKQRYEQGQFENGKRTGTWQSFYGNGQTEIKSNYKDGLLEGSYLQYDPYGDLMIKTNYKAGVLEGDWSKLENGVMLEEGKFTKGKRDGKWLYYEFIGSFASTVEYYNSGKRTGVWNSYHSNRRKASEIRYVDDQPVGLAKTWHSNKQLASVTRYRLGLADSIYTEYFRDGKMALTGTYNLGAREGVWKYYHQNGLISELGKYANNKRTGNWKTFSEKGGLIAEGNYILDVEEGQWFNYYDNGSLESIGSFKNGEKDGLWGYFHKSSKPMYEETWKEGKLMMLSDFTNETGTTYTSGSIKNGNGTRYNYTTKGNKYSEGPYKDGLPNGEWTFFDEKERKLMTGTLVNGVKEGNWMIYARSGRVIRVEAFSNGEMIDSFIR